MIPYGLGYEDFMKCIKTLLPELSEKEIAEKVKKLKQDFIKNFPELHNFMNTIGANNDK